MLGASASYEAFQAGELDISTAPDLQDALAELTDAPRRVVVDLSDLEFCDSTGLSVFVRAKNSTDDAGGDPADQRFDSTLVHASLPLMVAAAFVVFFGKGAGRTGQKRPYPTDWPNRHLSKVKSTP